MDQQVEKVYMDGNQLEKMQHKTEDANEILFYLQDIFIIGDP